MCVLSLLLICIVNQFLNGTSNDDTFDISIIGPTVAPSHGPTAALLTMAPTIAPTEVNVDENSV